jgi:hypothetical protein
MTQMSEMNEEGPPSQKVPEQSGLGLMLLKMLAKPGALKRMRVMDPDEERYVRPPRPYELPEYREGMPHCTSNEKYLRPTRWCNPREPEVIAMANELGAYELSEWEFAEAAFWFVKTNFTPEFRPLGPVSDSLKKGTGTCFHMNSVWAALCRAAGIKARYKTFNMMLPPLFLTGKGSERGKEVANMFNRGLPEIEGEVCIDGKWVVGYLAMRPELLANAYVPITRLGEDAIGLTFPLAPGATITRFEGVTATSMLPMRISFGALLRLAPAAMERANLVVKEAVLLGSKVIEGAGGLEEYDRQARSKDERLPVGKIVDSMKEAMHPELVDVEFKE